jgi:signal transduction histidine kinase
MLSNLVSNALKYVEPQGWVQIEFELVSGRPCLRVRDNGAGIESRHLQRLFEAFYKADPGEKSGAGLGLSIVKSIADLHNAVIDIKSEKGQGTCLSVTWPPVRS